MNLTPRIHRTPLRGNCSKSYTCNYERRKFGNYQKLSSCFVQHASSLVTKVPCFRFHIVVSYAHPFGIVRSYGDPVSSSDQFDFHIKQLLTVSKELQHFFTSTDICIFTQVNLKTRVCEKPSSLQEAPGTRNVVIMCHKVLQMLFYVHLQKKTIHLTPLQKLLQCTPVVISAADLQLRLRHSYQR